MLSNQFGRRNLSDYQRGVLALRMKPIMEERAKANLIASGENFGKGSQKSDEPIKPIRTDEAVSTLANVSRDTIKKWFAWQWFADWFAMTGRRDGRRDGRCWRPMRI